MVGDEKKLSFCITSNEAELCFVADVITNVFTAKKAINVLYS